MFKTVYIAFFVCCLDMALSIRKDHKLQLQSRFETVAEICAKENSITKEDIAAFMARRFPEGQEAACFSACVLKNIGLINDEGLLSHDTAVENAKTVFGEGDEIKTIEDFIETCKDSVLEGADACERAKLVFKCFVDHADKFDF